MGVPFIQRDGGFPIVRQRSSFRNGNEPAAVAFDDPAGEKIDAVLLGHVDQLRAAVASAGGAFRSIRAEPTLPVVATQ
ncbi:hypothetical protein CO666_27700 [Rhizobium chutanense]|uniref:Uncharacterized protein n=1 Tax=Rhizobium chutanense TaxID=2035448 RepID=A0A2A6J4W9_9HYPH|nr:hypothetical protein [Rhizobium chutanense]PDT00924.1 hypothetical protein CO666_27700 [Rhizobium chutanense]